MFCLVLGGFSSIFKYFVFCIEGGLQGGSPGILNSVRLMRACMLLPPSAAAAAAAAAAATAAAAAAAAASSLSLRNEQKEERGLNGRNLI